MPMHGFVHCSRIHNTALGDLIGDVAVEPVARLFGVNEIPKLR